MGFQRVLQIHASPEVDYQSYQRRRPTGKGKETWSDAQSSARGLENISHEWKMALSGILSTNDGALSEEPIGVEKPSWVGRRRSTPMHFVANSVLPTSAARPPSSSKCFSFVIQTLIVRCLLRFACSVHVLYWWNSEESRLIVIGDGPKRFSDRVVKPQSEDYSLRFISFESSHVRIVRPRYPAYFVRA